MSGGPVGAFRSDGSRGRSGAVAGRRWGKTSVATRTRSGGASARADLSRAAAEHEGLLRPRAACLLRVQLHKQAFTFGGQVVWSEAIGRTGPGRLRFQSGIAFTEIPVAAAPLLAHLLEQASLAG